MHANVDDAAHLYYAYIVQVNIEWQLSIGQQVVTLQFAQEDLQGLQNIAHTN